MTVIQKQLYSLNKISKKSVAIYHRAALSMGVCDSALGVLYALMESDAPCSQYDLCSEWFIPKQTINSTVSALNKKGLVELSPIAGTKNKKSIALTKEGRELADKTVCLIRDAEIAALSELSCEERELYVRLNQKYNQSLTEKIDSLLESFSNESA